MHKYTKCIKFAILALFLYNFIHVSNANCATKYADSCSQSDVQSAINSANDGDIVIIPAGEFTWTTTAQDEPSVLIDSKSSITLQGAGMDSTIITDGTDNGGDEVPLYITGTSDGFRLTGMQFKGMARTVDSDCVANEDPYLCCTGVGVGSCTGTSEPALKIAGNYFRVDHCKFDGSGAPNNPGRGMMVYSYGLIDNCTFKDTYQGVAVFGTGATSWTTPQNLGSADATYIEDCVFDYSAPFDGAMDAYGGARYVFRYNTVINTKVGHHGTDTGGYRSTHSFEIYENTYSLSLGGSQFSPGHFRGGTGVIYNNTFTGDYKKWFILSNYRSCSFYPNWGKCDGTIANDGNTEPKATYYGWPCLDQIGRTTDQTSSPLYEWENTVNGADMLFGVNASCEGEPNMTTHLKEGRDFISNTQKPGYSPYTYPHPLTKETVMAAPVLMMKDTFSGGSVWTKSTGKTYTYYLTSKKYGGRYIKKVTEDDTELVKIASVDLCESTTGSYFLDSSDGTLYVHCTDGADPDTHEIEVYYN